MPGSTLISIETEAGGWEVQVATSDGVENEATVDASGSTITSGPTAKNESDADRRKHQARIAAAKVDYTRAAATIGAAVPGTITELNLDDSRGMTVWEADVRTTDGSTVSVKIDAGSGAEVTRSTETG